jgi:hypothetical protein
MEDRMITDLSCCGLKEFGEISGYMTTVFDENKRGSISYWDRAAAESYLLTTLDSLRTRHGFDRFRDNPTTFPHLKCGGIIFTDARYSNDGLKSEYMSNWLKFLEDEQFGPVHPMPVFQNMNTMKYISAYLWVPDQPKVVAWWQDKNAKRAAASQAVPAAPAPDSGNPHFLNSAGNIFNNYLTGVINR